MSESLGSNEFFEWVILIVKKVYSNKNKKMGHPVRSAQSLIIPHTPTFAVIVAPCNSLDMLRIYTGSPLTFVMYHVPRWNFTNPKYMSYTMGQLPSKESISGVNGRGLPDPTRSFDLPYLFHKSMQGLQVKGYAKNIDHGRKEF